MKFTVTINCDSRAFEDDLSCEVANVLRKIARSVEKDGSQGGRLADSNGDICGEYQFADASEEQTTKREPVAITIWKDGAAWFELRDEDGAHTATFATREEASAYGVAKFIDTPEPRFLVRDESGRGWCSEIAYTQFDADDREFISDEAQSDEEEYGIEAQTFGEWLDNSSAGDEYHSDDMMTTTIRIN